MNKPLGNLQDETTTITPSPLHSQPGATTPATDRRDNTAVLMQLAAIGYWIVFWGMNALDKFLNRTDLGLFTWYGKDRTAQFAGYYENMALSPDLIGPTLVFAGIWEFAVLAPFVIAAVCVLRRTWPAGLTGLINWGFALSAATFIAFSIFDVVAGDRAELREHGYYLILVFVSWIMVVMTAPKIGAR